MDPLYFKIGDLDFIQKEYPELYHKLEKNISKDRLTVALDSPEQWDMLENSFVDEIGASTTNAGDLNKNGLRLEAILDCV